MTEVMITVLNTDQRRFLDAQTQRARAASEHAAEEALRALAVVDLSRPAYLNDEQNKLRLALREKGRQLGDDTSRAGGQLTNLVHDVAYEQWHRLLFARFLEINELLRHPEYRDIPLSLEDCGDFAPDLGEPDAWAVAARFASEILPGVFRLTDPAVQVRFAAEHRNALERLLLEIPAEVFKTEDALGWVYQFWQTAEKKRVNDSGVKIGGADLSPVTQLFTENYMVRFLLENSLGAWWASRRPESPLVASWEYLRRNDDGTPAAGTFSDWPERTADVTVMDPCCGSGHFLVAMFGMLWRMRAEEEGLAPAEAQDAVLRDNLHGLELDPRCVQIAVFALVLETWKQGGYRSLPVPRIACTGVRASSSLEEWHDLAKGDHLLEAGLARLHSLFAQADSLGSLIDPVATSEQAGLESVDWETIAPLLGSALRNATSTSGDSATAVLSATAVDIASAADYLSRKYTLVSTNPPYLGRGKHDSALAGHLNSVYSAGRADLSTSFVMRIASMTKAGGSCVVVMPQAWFLQASYVDFRMWISGNWNFRLAASLGEEGFDAFGIRGPRVSLNVLERIESGSTHGTALAIDASSKPGMSPVLIPEKMALLKASAFSSLVQEPNGQRRFLLGVDPSSERLSTYVGATEGLSTGDSERYIRQFWEVNVIGREWERIQGAPDSTGVGGRSQLIRWNQGQGELHTSTSARIQGNAAWSKSGVLVGRMRSIRATHYVGDKFDKSCVAIIPYRNSDLEAVRAFCTSAEFSESVRQIDGSLNVPISSLLSAPFDLEQWRSRSVAADAANSPNTDDPTQWTFSEGIVGSKYPLQVAVATLLGFRWPDRDSGAFDVQTDTDGIAALVSLPGEPDLATRLREVLAASYGSEWSSATERKLVVDTDGKNGKLEDWLHDRFFAQHVKDFGNRPFLWHIWDGRKDGFSAIVNYHKLDRRTLEKLTFTSLGAWIDRQRHEARAERAGADARLAAAEDLQRRLQLILDGVPPYDVYVRWKPMAQQTIGWEPDLDDGVRLNLRPFVNADVLRAKVNVHWRKDRGANPDGSERHNDLHPSLDERRAARKVAEAAE